MLSEDCFIRMRPTSVEPVKVIFRTFSLLVSSPPIADEDLPVMTLSSPFGRPARSANSASASADRGVIVAGFRTIAQPTASAGPALPISGTVAISSPVDGFNTGTDLPESAPTHAPSI